MIDIRYLNIFLFSFIVCIYVFLFKQTIPRKYYSIIDTSMLSFIIKQNFYSFVRDSSKRVQCRTIFQNAVYGKKQQQILSFERRVDRKLVGL